jgi:hypothetical protein
MWQLWRRKSIGETEPVSSQYSVWANLAAFRDQ